MKRYRLFFGVALILLLILSVSLFNFSGHSSYQKAISNFHLITVETVQNNIKYGNDFILYMGQEDCPYCVEFVPLLSQISEDNDLQVIYLDTANTESDSEMSNFRDMHHIEFVPSLLIQNDGELYFPKIPDTYEELVNLFQKLDLF